MQITDGDLLVSGYGLVHRIRKIHCDHVIEVDDYYEPLTETKTLEFAGFVPVWRKKEDHCGSDNVPAGGSLNLLEAPPKSELRGERWMEDAALAYVRATIASLEKLAKRA
jgi:hypothetical protein